MDYIRVCLRGQDFKDLIHGKCITVKHNFHEIRISLEVSRIGFQLMRHYIDDAELNEQVKNDDKIGREHEP